MAIRSVEFLIPHDTVRKAREFLVRLRSHVEQTLRNEATWTETEDYEGKSDLLITYGPGDRRRYEAMDAQVARGKHAVAFDLGYWERWEHPHERMYRITFDARHPQAFVYKKPLGTEKFDRNPIKITDLWKPDGHILICGTGPKSRRTYRDDWDWDTRKLAEIRQAFPDHKVYYRPKPSHQDELPGVKSMRDGEIESALNGAFLVVCRHSNVAVDAAAANVSCVCDDGIGAAFWPSKVGEIFRPTLAQRRDFLYRVAWFQWSMQETPQCWRFIQEMLCD